MSVPIRVLIADDHSVLRAGLVALLDREPDIDVVGEASDGVECVEKVRSCDPDVVLMDLNMPNCGGLEALDLIRDEYRDTRVLVLTMHDDMDYLRHVLAAGGSGFILKQAASEELLTAIRSVDEGGVFLHPHHARLLANDQEDRAMSPGDSLSEAARAYASLSDREAEVFRQVALGHTNAEIADLLFLSVKTVETYKSRLKRKLGVESRAELVRLAIDLDLLS